MHSNSIFIADLQHAKISDSHFVIDSFYHSDKFLFWFNSEKVDNEGVQYT